MAGSNARNAWPRWLMAFFSSGLARRSCGPGRSAAAPGRSRSRLPPAARAAACPQAGRTPPPRGRRQPPPARHGESRRADERGPAVLIRNIRELGEQEPQVGGVVPVPAAPPRRKDSRGAAQDVHGQSGVVGDRHQPGCLGHCAGLQQGVLGKRHARSRRRPARRRRRRPPPVCRRRAREPARAAAPGVRGACLCCAWRGPAREPGRSRRPRPPSRGFRQGFALDGGELLGAQQGQVQQLCSARRGRRVRPRLCPGPPRTFRTR